MDGALLADQPLGQKLISKGFWLYFFTFIIAPAGYIIKVVISNKMSVEDVGLFYSIMGLIYIISLYNDLGLTEALQYFLPKYRIRKEYNKVKTITILTWIIQLISGIIIAGALYIGSDWLAINYFHSPQAAHIIRLLCLYFFGINFIQVFMSFFIAFQDTFNQNLVEFVRIYTTLIFVGVFYFTTTITLDNFTWARLIGIGVSIITGIIIFSNKYLHIFKLGKYNLEIGLLKKQLKYAGRVFLGANVGLLFWQVNQQMVMYMLGSEQAGYITNFWSLFAMFNYVIAPLSMFLFPVLTEMIEKKEHEQVTIFQNILYKYTLLFSFICGGFFMILGPEIALVFFGKKFIYSGVLFSYAAPFVFLSTLLTVSFAIIGAMGMVKKRVKILSIGLLVNISISYILIRYTSIGIVGSILGLLSGWGILTIMVLKVVNTQYKIKIDYMFLIKNVILIGIMIWVVRYTKDYFFIMENYMRYRNIFILCIYLMIFSGIIGLVNYKQINLFLTEIKKIRNK
ncbi:MAG: oligosaccharide flippase family protein [Candidatus Absconditicoccaceae bacterium]